MKIISGKYKGRKLEGHNIVGTRPTMDRVKESLFGIIQNHLEDSTVLDLFSGSGNLGIEALSEGAAEAFLVDNNLKAINTIKNNIKNIKISSANVLNMDYKKALKYFFEEKIIFDLIFLDPPYQTNYLENSLQLIDDYNLLNNDGIIICESNNIDKIVYRNNFTAIKNKKYGDKYIVILKKI